MNSPKSVESTQMIMPGMPASGSLQGVLGGWQLRPGVEVTYNGHIRGGPQFGASGIVREVRGRRVVVDLQGWGVWQIPSYFLSVRMKAA